MVDNGYIVLFNPEWLMSMYDMTNDRNQESIQHVLDRSDRGYLRLVMDRCDQETSDCKNPNLQGGFSKWGTPK